MGDAGISTPSKRGSGPCRGVAKNLLRLLGERPDFRLFSSGPPAWPQSTLFGHSPDIILRCGCRSERGQSFAIVAGRNGRIGRFTWKTCCRAPLLYSRGSAWLRQWRIEGNQTNGIRVAWNVLLCSVAHDCTSGPASWATLRTNIGSAAWSSAATSERNCADRSVWTR